MKAETIFNLLLFGLLATCFVAATAEAKTEAQYVDEDCPTYKGVVEFRNSDNTRTDCMTMLSAMEYDFGNKWYECVMQALHYARESGKFAVCRLIIRNDNEFRLSGVARSDVRFYRLPVYITLLDAR